jgi:hypothetical protein
MRRLWVVLAISLSLVVLCSPLASAIECVQEAYCFYCQTCGLGNGDLLLLFDPATQTAYWTCAFLWVCNADFNDRNPPLCAGAIVDWQPCIFSIAGTSPLL